MPYVIFVIHLQNNELLKTFQHSEKSLQSNIQHQMAKIIYSSHFQSIQTLQAHPRDYQTFPFEP
jgi:hypothetical protein